MFARGRRLEQFAAEDELKLLVQHVEQALKEERTPSVEVIAALEYFRDPFDDVYDAVEPYGLDDGAPVIRRAARTLIKESARPHGNSRGSRRAEVDTVA